MSGFDPPIEIQSAKVEIVYKDGTTEYMEWGAAWGPVTVARAGR